jgi:hypothetical protein
MFCIFMFYFMIPSLAQAKFFFNWYSGGWSPIGSTRHYGHQWPIVPAPGDYDDGEIGGMIGRGNRSTRRKSAPVPLCPPKTPHVAQAKWRPVVGWLMSNKLESMWKEAFVAWFEILFRHLPGQLWEIVKTSVRITDVPVKIWTNMQLRSFIT